MQRTDGQNCTWHKLKMSYISYNLRLQSKSNALAFAEAEPPIVTFRQEGYVFTNVSLCLRYWKTTDQIFMKFYGIRHNTGTSDLDPRSRSLEVKGKRITTFKIVEESRDKIKL